MTGRPTPRRIGITEIRGPYYTLIGQRYLEDVLETIGRVRRRVEVRRRLVQPDAARRCQPSHRDLPRTSGARLDCRVHRVRARPGRRGASIWGRIKTFKETGRVPSAPDEE